MAKQISGTLEWAPINRNWQRGCEHGCLYCYAFCNACRFKRVLTREQWLNPVLSHRALMEKPRKLNGRIMCPTTHDITPKNIETSVSYLRAWLAAGNEFLIVSKPHLNCIKRLCEELRPYSSRIVFRFTIGSAYDDVLSFWEPHAPIYFERLQALEYAFSEGYKTSVSCEPFLDAHISIVVREVLPFVTDTAWIGKMNKPSQRVDKTGWGEPEYKMLKSVTEAQSDDAIKALYERLKVNPKIRWKESIKKVLGLPPAEAAGLDV